MRERSDAGLVRGFRRWDLVALVLNAIIGAGIFGLPSTVQAHIGTYSVFAWLLCAIPIVLIILCFAEVGSRFKETGGPYLYARVAFGPLIGFEVGWLMWLARLTAFAALCNLFVGYLGYFIPGSSAGLWRAFVIATVVVSLTLTNIMGVRSTAAVNNVLTVGKLIPLLLFVVVGLFFISPQNYSLAARPSHESFSTAMLLIVFAYSGFEAAVVPAGEARDPGRHFPFALLTGIGVVVVVYALIQVVCIGTLPELARSERPLSDASLSFLGAAGASVISAGALVSVAGTMNGIVLVASRLLFAMAEQRQLPEFLVKVHGRFHTPHVAILLSTTVMLGLTLFSTFVSALTISTIIRLITYVATCAALPALRSKPGILPAAFTAPAGLFVSGAALAFSVWLLSTSSWDEARVVGIASALGLLLHVTCAPRGEDRHKRPAASIATP
jgi:basic amino acid/polyamine antiporter, APA family